MHAPNFRHAHAQAPPASLWGRLTHSKRWAVALVAAIVAPLFLFAAPAQAAVQGTIRGWTSGPQLHFDNHKAETPALINLAVVSSLSGEEFHEASEGLGILAQVPPEPTAADGKMLADVFRRFL